MSDGAPRLVPTCSHWGNYRVEVTGGRITDVHPYPEDLQPTPISRALLSVQDPNCRVLAPMVRSGYLDGRRDGTRRGREAFVPVSWDEALDLAAESLDAIRKQHGNEAIFGGSYGWSSAGRFHHAQSQVHRFLNSIGGYSSRVDSYSAAAAEVITPHVLGMDFYEVMFQAPTVEDMLTHTKLVVCFGGIAMKNTQVMAGGLGGHTAPSRVEQLARAAIDFVNISPVRDDMSAALNAEWWPARPVSDVAIMLALAHTLVSENRYDAEFVDRYCVGFDDFRPYLLGETDGQPKDAAWAQAISEIPASAIGALARRMADERTVIGISWSLQRSEHGEQSYWMASVLGALLGYHGLPGGGVAYGYGSVHNVGFAGRRMPNFRVAALPKGKNPIKAYIPVARIADCLLNPGQSFDYNGHKLSYPDVRLIYWAGGNPFHHHQDLNRLRQAWSRPDTIIVNEPFWTATARHADIVFPCTTPLERNDIGLNPYDCYLSPMPQAIEPFAAARNDYDVFTDLADRLGSKASYTEGRSEMDWVRFLYDKTRDAAGDAGVSLPDFDTFWRGEQFSIADQLPDRVFKLEAFRADPENNALKTPSGKIEIFSETIASFDYPDCRGHPAWYEKTEFLGAERGQQFPLHLISNQPPTRLHSQYDHGETSRKRKIKGRERARMHPEDAGRRGISDGDVVRLFNDRGSCLAGIELTPALRPGVVELPTGAWYDPVDPEDPKSLDVHGNPNVLTRDAGTSLLGQGTTAHSCLVEVERFEGELPPVRAFQAP